MRERNIDYAAFAATWNAATSAAEVAKQLNISLDAVYRRLRTAKAHGYKCVTHRRKNLSDEEFIVIYSTAKSDAEVAEQTKLGRFSIRQKAFRLREKGYELPYRRQQGALVTTSADDQNSVYDDAFAQMGAEPLELDEPTDGRRKNGGQRAGAGRPPTADEPSTLSLSPQARKELRILTRYHRALRDKSRLSQAQLLAEFIHEKWLEYEKAGE